MKKTLYVRSTPTKFASYTCPPGGTGTGRSYTCPPGGTGTGRSF